MKRTLIAASLAAISISARADTLRFRSDDHYTTMTIQTSEGMHMFLWDEVAPARRAAAELFGKINPGTVELSKSGRGWSCDYDAPMTREASAR